MSVTANSCPQCYSDRVEALVCPQCVRIDKKEEAVTHSDAETRVAVLESQLAALKTTNLVAYRGYMTGLSTACRAAEKLDERVKELEEKLKVREARPDEAKSGEWTNDHNTAQAWLNDHIARGYAMGNTVEALVSLLRESRSNQETPEDWADGVDAAAGVVRAEANKKSPRTLTEIVKTLEELAEHYPDRAHPSLGATAESMVVVKNLRDMQVVVKNLRDMQVFYNMKDEKTGRLVEVLESAINLIEGRNCL